MLLLPVTLVNQGGQEATSVIAQLTSLSPHLNRALRGGRRSRRARRCGRSRQSPAFQVSVDPAAAGGEILEVTVGVSVHGGPPVQTGFRLKVGGAFYDDMESDRGWSIAAPDDDAASGAGSGSIPTALGTRPLANPDHDHTAAPGTSATSPDTRPWWRPDSRISTAARTR